MNIFQQEKYELYQTTVKRADEIVQKVMELYHGKSMEDALKYAYFKDKIISKEEYDLVRRIYFR